MPARRSALALLAVLFIAAPCLARADEFADFRVPANRVLLWTGSVSSSAAWNSREDQLNHEQSGRGSASFASYLYYSRESEARLRAVVASASAGGNRMHQVAHSVNLPYYSSAEERTTRDASGSASISLLEQWFPESLPVNLSCQAGASLDEARTWSTSKYFDHYLLPGSSYRSETGFDDQWLYAGGGSAALGIGVGRARNATGLYEALVFEKRLLASGVLTRPLGPEAKRDLAALFYARGDYARSTDRPAEPVWAAIEGILARDGALATPGLDPRRLFDAVAPFLGARRYLNPDGLLSSPVLRRCGWAVGAIVTGQTQQYIQRMVTGTTYVDTPGGAPSSYRIASRFTDPTDLAMGGVAAEFHRPVGLRWQWDANLTAQVPLKSGLRGLDVTSALSAAWIVTDRWLATASVQQRRYLDQDASGFTRSDNWSVSPLATCEYWVSDHVDLRLQFLQAWVRDRTDQYGLGVVPMNRRQSGGVSFGLDYRFAGFTEIPGIAGMAR